MTHADTEKYYDRLRRLLPRTTSLELLLLKGHLLLEENLASYIRHSCRRVDSLDRVRLSFAQTVHLFQALAGWPDDDPHVRFLWELNRLRNRFAHRIEPGDLGVEVESLLRILAGPDAPSPRNATQRATWLRQALMITAALTLGIAEERGVPKVARDAT